MQVVGLVMKVPLPDLPFWTSRLFRVENGAEGGGSSIVNDSWKSLSQATSVLRKTSSLPAITNPKRAGSPFSGSMLYTGTLVPVDSLGGTTAPFGRVCPAGNGGDGAGTAPATFVTRVTSS